MEETVMKLRILAKAETTLFKAQARRASRQARLALLAIGLLLLTVVMINVAAYNYLQESLSPAAAALIVAASNGFLAVILLWQAARQQPGPEEAMVQEIRQMAMTELNNDLDEVRDEFRQFTGDLQHIREQVSTGLSLFRGGGGAIGSLGSAVSLISAMLKR